MRRLKSTDAKHIFGRLVGPARPLTLVLCLALPPALVVPRASAQEPERAYVFEGNVRDAGTGQPLAGAQVSVVGGETRAVTLGDGSFHLTGLAAGGYVLRAERLGYRGATVVVAVGTERARRAVAESAEVVIELTPSPIALDNLVVTATISERAAGASERPDREPRQRRQYRVPQPPVPGEGDHAGGRSESERQLSGGVLTGPYPTPSRIPSSRLATSRLRRLLTYTLSAPIALSPRIDRRQISSAVAPLSNSRVISRAGTGK